MHYNIKESNHFNIIKYDNIVNIDIDDFNMIINRDYIGIIRKLLKNNGILDYISLSDDVYDLFFNYITGNFDDNDFINYLTSIDIPLYSLLLGSAKIYKRQYEALVNFDNAKSITFICNKDNIYNVLSRVSSFDTKIVINSCSMSLEDYKKSLSNFDFNIIEGLDILIYYQENNSCISAKRLYEVSCYICNIADEIKKYNLSLVEQIMYVYDIAKEREYSECVENGWNSRDLDKVIDGNNIVCVGYSNLFNAILGCLGIKTFPLIDSEKKHQCSLVYIKDEKYGIDGVYKFDVTGDSRRSSDYIGNYNFFGICTRIDDRDVFGNILKNLISDFDKFISMDDKVDVLEEYSIFLNKCEVLFELASENFNMFLHCIDLETEAGKKESNILFRKFLRKFRCPDIKIKGFIRMLYHTRRIQYYNGIVNDFDLDEIFNATIKRYVFLNREELKRKGISTFECLLESILYEEELTNMLEDRGKDIIEPLLTFSDSIIRDSNNIRIVKILRNRQKQLTEEKK